MNRPMPVAKYRPFHETNPVHLPDRTWPDKHITAPPRWLSTDLRDGNQALIEPMDPARNGKCSTSSCRWATGIESVPAASQTDFDFVRSIIDDDAVPDDVVISVLTQARGDLIDAP